MSGQQSNNAQLTLAIGGLLHEAGKMAPSRNHGTVETMAEIIGGEGNAMSGNVQFAGNVEGTGGMPNAAPNTGGADMARLAQMAASRNMN